MNITTRLEDIQYAASLCLKCGACAYGAWPENHPLCSIYYRDPCITHGASGLLHLVPALTEKWIDYDRALAELSFTCTGCLACDSRCTIIKAHPPQVDILDIIRLLRYEAVKRGFIPDGMAKKMYDEVKKTGDLGNKTSIELPEKIKSDKSNTVIFAECAHNGSEKNISTAIASVLAKIGSPVATFTEKRCCGSTLYDYGFWDQLGPLVKDNWAKMRGLKAKNFIFTNPHCEEFIVKRYPRSFPIIKASVISI